MSDRRDPLSVPTPLRGLTLLALAGALLAAPLLRSDPRPFWPALRSPAEGECLVSVLKAEEGRVARVEDPQALLPAVEDRPARDTAHRTLELVNVAAVAPLTRSLCKSTANLDPRPDLHVTARCVIGGELKPTNGAEYDVCRTHSDPSHTEASP